MAYDAGDYDASLKKAMEIADYKGFAKRRREAARRGRLRGIGFSTYIEACGLAPSQAVGALARKMPVSRPAVSQHLKVLKEAGLVADRPEGTRRVYYIDPDGLGALRAWVDQFWDRALENFQAEVELRANEERKKEK